MRAGQEIRPFSETRFRVPVRSERFIRRPRITALLDSHLSHPVTLVTGPAGTGKTLAVADWTLVGHPPGVVAWLSLDRGDAGLTRFWASVLSALVAAAPGALSGLEIPDAPDADFLESVAGNAGGLVLVLDDVQELDGGTALDWIDRVLRWPPAGVRFVLVARHDPPVSLQRLRLEGRVGELRLADLAFTPAESEELMAESGVTLTPVALERLMESTAGWAAALRMAALTLQVAEDPTLAIERFGGVTFLVSEYLWDEVLQLLPPAYSEFLLRTSVTGRLCTPLAVALTDEPRADEMLRTLAREQLLAHEVEGTGWYRTHSLLTEVLRARLMSTSPELAQDLHRRAALWFEDNGAWTKALAHATASGDWDFAGRMAMRSGAVALFTTDRQPYVEAMSRVPAAVTVDHPELAVAHAVAAYCRGDRGAVEGLLARADISALPERRRGLATITIESLRAAQAHRDGDALVMREASTRADELLAGISAAEAPGWAAYGGFSHALRGVAELWAGRPDLAARLLAQAVESYPAGPLNAYGEVYYGGILALAQAGSGRLSLARGTAEDALEVARRHGRSRSYESQWAWLALATTLLYAGDTDGAASARSQCADAGGESINPFVAATLQIITARQALGTGDLAGARRGAAAARAAVARRPGMLTPMALLTSLRVDLALAEGDTEAARIALAEYDASPIGRGEAPAPRPDAVSNCRARFLLATGRPERVRATVAHLLDVVGGEAVQAWLSVAAAEDRLRHDSLAIEAMGRALDLAASEGAELFLLRQSRQLAAALRRHRDVVGSHLGLVDRALGIADGSAPSPGRRALVPLTERERAVLSYLPTMGSNAEIAAALSVSENTVKQHLKSIYRKLTVNSRREAVRVARDAGLLDGLTRTIAT
ncbi:LuxR C-terminal-related transcriptional regulator [Tessaracoccus sp. G1721]